MTIAPLHIDMSQVNCVTNNTPQSANFDPMLDMLQVNYVFYNNRRGANFDLSLVMSQVKAFKIMPLTFTSEKIMALTLNALDL